MTAADVVLSYAQPWRERRPWSRPALRSLGFVLLHPVLVAFPLLYAADRKWLPQHFLCCNHPEVTVLAFTVLPLLGTAWAASAIVRIVRDKRRPRPRGIIVASLALLIGIALAGCGVVLLQVLKASRV